MNYLVDVRQISENDSAVKFDIITLIIFKIEINIIVYNMLIVLCYVARSFLHLRLARLYKESM